MKSIVYIIPYFGKMRTDFSLWLKTCEYNPTVNWLIFTDDHDEYPYPENVQVIYSTFEDVVKRFQDMYDFQICLDKPYKLCDFKPAYGEVFSEYIQTFDFWGYCDVDLLWGNIRKFLTDDILETYDKIGFLGHSTLYRNTPDVNCRYKITGKSEIDYKYAFTSNENFFFDERAMNEIYDACGWKYYKKQIFADLTDYRYNFFLTNVAEQDKEKNSRQIFYWCKGELIRNYMLDNKVYTDSFMYIHFLKRKMDIDIKSDTCEWMIIPNMITDHLEKATVSVVKKYSKPHWGKYFLNLFIEKKDKINAKNLIAFLVRRSRKYYDLKYHNDTLNDRKM